MKRLIDWLKGLPGEAHAPLMLMAGMIAYVLLFVFVIDPYLPGGSHYSKKKVYVPVGVHTITAYQAVKGQCDSTPDIGAYGRVARNGKPLGRYFASNRYPKGTKIVIPSVSGDIVWICMDKMNSRYSGDYIDLLVSKDAIIVGKQKAKVLIVQVIK